MALTVGACRLFSNSRAISPKIATSVLGQLRPSSWTTGVPRFALPAASAALPLPRIISDLLGWTEPGAPPSSPWDEIILRAVPKSKVRTAALVVILLFRSSLIAP